VALALALLVIGFAYYVSHTAEHTRWFLTTAPYYTYIERASGLKIGDPVMLMGLTVGQITRMEPMPPDSPYNICVEFEIKDPYYGYLWTEGSRAKVTAADLLGKRVLEVTKGTNGYPTFVFYPLREVSLTEARSLPGLSDWLLAQEVRDSDGTNVVAKAKTPLSNFTGLTVAGRTNLLIMNKADERKTITGIWNDTERRYDPFTSKSEYWLVAEESAAVTERLEKLVEGLEHALPNILGLTNQLAAILSNSASLTSNLNAVAVDAQPAARNLADLATQLRRPGGLGEWLFATNVYPQIEDTLGTAQAALAHADTNLTALAENLDRSFENLANLTSNLNSQVQANTNILGEISRAIVNADSFIQGLKRHWLLRSAFRTKKTNAPPPTESRPLRSPKDRNER